MPTVFVYEYCCALGVGRHPSDPAHSLYREGRAMRDAVAEDFRRLPGVTVLLSNHDDVPEPAAGRPRPREPVFEGLARRADFTLIIAPETGGELLKRCGWAMNTETRLLGSSFAGIAGSLKPTLANRWPACGVPTPYTAAPEHWPADRFPCVVKPAVGAGSENTYLVRDPAALGDATRRVTAAGQLMNQALVQDFVPGRPASVAFLVGPSQTVPLLPTFQLLSPDGRFRYEGGELPIRPDLAARAVALGRRAIDCVPGLLGYVGVDLILGDATDGSRDYAIEINPRLTTSYVGLRRLADVNLAEVMLNVATGQPVGDLRWRPGRVRFRPDGTVAYEPDAPWFGPG